MNSTENTGESTNPSLAKGILGAVVGAALGIGAMFGFYTLSGIRFPLLGVGIGILTGFGARLANKGGETTLGYVSAGIAVAAVVATLYLMYGTSFSPLNIISVVISASFAYRIAGR